MSRENAVVHVAEIKDYLDVVGSSYPVHFGLEAEGFTFKESESVSHAFLLDLGGVLDTFLNFFVFFSSSFCFSFFVETHILATNSFQI